jgi:hypothetical protein
MKKKTEILVLFVLLMLFVSGAHASEYGCKVLLCLANPASNGGPTGVAECVEPIHRLYHDLARGKPFPTCDMADGNDGSCYARVVHEPYDPCPADAPDVAVQGEYIVQGTLQGDGKFTLNGQPVLVEDQSNYAQTMACVGDLQGRYTVSYHDDGGTSYLVSVYQKIVWQQRYWRMRAIDIYIDNQFYQRVRW